MFRKICLALTAMLAAIVTAVPAVAQTSITYTLTGTLTGFLNGSSTEGSYAFSFVGTGSTDDLFPFGQPLPDRTFNVGPLSGQAGFTFLASGPDNSLVLSGGEINYLAVTAPAGFQFGTAFAPTPVSYVGLFPGEPFREIFFPDLQQGFEPSGGSGLMLGATITSGAPEPGTWAMMIVGFGLAGSALRRRKTPARRFAIA